MPAAERGAADGAAAVGLVGVAVVEVGGDLLERLPGRVGSPGFELFACELCGDEGEEGAVAIMWDVGGAFLDALDGSAVESGEPGELACGEVPEGG